MNSQTFIHDGKWMEIVNRQVEQKVEQKVGGMTTELDTINKMVVETKYKADEERTGNREGKML